MRRVALGVALLLALSACSGGADDAPVARRTAAKRKPKSTVIPASPPSVINPTTAEAPAPHPRPSASLRTFDSCADLLDDVKREALALVGPYGLTPRQGSAVPQAVPASGDTAGSATAAGGAAAGGGGGGTSGHQYSGTNLQEEGIDEADDVKTDGSQVLAVAGDKLHRILLDEGGPRLTATLTIERGWPMGERELFLAGDRALLMGIRHPAEGSATTADQPDRADTAIWAIDLHDDGSMQVVEVLGIDGHYVSARMVEGIVRVVVSSRLERTEFVTPTDDSAEALEAATRENRRLIEQSTLGDWVPDYALEDHRGPEPVITASGQFGECESTMRPEGFSGFGAVSVLTFDPRRPGPNNVVTVIGEGNTVYASAESLYVTTDRWNGGLVSGTEIHKFDIADRTRTEYRASGIVPGGTLNQWALSERDGYLRVATTLDDLSDESESRVTVLAEQGRQLVPVGEIGDLGRGESILAVRYLGDLAYVVTFRQIDPLYVLDLSDPRKPTRRGELTMPGYSAYLHPLSGGLLLGVGQDATEDGQPLGTKVSLFDVSNPDHPRLLHERATGEGNSRSSLDHDHRAFLYWPPRGLAVVPIHTWQADTESYAAEAVGLSVGPWGIEEVGHVTHQGRPTSPGEFKAWASIGRPLVVDDTIYTVSMLGLLANDLDTFEERAWVAF